jgi:hypothetical protein
VPPAARGRGLDGTRGRPAPWTRRPQGLFGARDRDLQSGVPTEAAPATGLVEVEPQARWSDPRDETAARAARARAQSRRVLTMAKGR